MTELEEAEQEYETTLSGYGRALAQGRMRGEREALRERYGGDLDARSHGESFLHIFTQRLHPNGLHLLDEPEAALSPQRQYALLFMLHDLISLGAQFIIATHSPILTALPGATILSFDQHPARRIEYEELEQVNFLRSFLNAPGRYLRQLEEEG
jgi:predicted ATPase